MRGTVMKAVMWFAALLLLLGAAMLLADIGATGLWIALITVGIALVIVGRRSRHITAKR
jgi:hypothetical protein